MSAHTCRRVCCHTRLYLRARAFFPGDGRFALIGQTVYMEGMVLAPHSAGASPRVALGGEHGRTACRRRREADTRAGEHHAAERAGKRGAARCVGGQHGRRSAGVCARQRAAQDHKLQLSEDVGRQRQHHPRVATAGRVGLLAISAAEARPGRHLRCDAVWPQRSKGQASKTGTGASRSHRRSPALCIC